MDVRARFLAGVARQLRRPQGLAGRAVGLALRRGNAATVTAAVSATGVGPGAAAADVGFGGGLGLALLLERVGSRGRVHGVEVSREMLAAARHRFRGEIHAARLVLHEAPMTRLPLADGSLDGLVTTNTLYFVEDLPSAFAEIARVLAPAGRAVVGIGDPDAMARMPFAPYGFRLRPVREVLAAAERAGLALVEHRGDASGPLRGHLLVLRRRDSGARPLGVGQA